MQTASNKLHSRKFGALVITIALDVKASLTLTTIFYEKHIYTDSGSIAITTPALILKY